MEKTYKLELQKKDIDTIIAGLGELKAVLSFQALCLIQEQLKKQTGNKDAKESPSGVHEKQREDHSQSSTEVTQAT